MEKIYDENLLEQYKHYSAIYGIEDNFNRMVPDARDGLKLIQRRILHVMYNELPCAKRKVKFTAIIGEATKIHPHGDSSIYGAGKVLSNWFDTKIPLIYSESHMGNYQGQGAAAPRYTEGMLSQFALDCVISDMKITKDVVDWSPTFDNSSMEPEFLPVSVPLLLINGTSGIGFGMRSEVPRHNITEVLEATINLIKNPNMPVVLIPDQCMPCEIIDTNWKSICNKGNGNYIARGIIDIEERKNGNYDLVIKSTPDGVSWNKGNEEKGGVKYKILEMVKNGKLPQITGIDEESKGNNMRVVIHLKKGSNPKFVKDFLYKNTSLQNTFYVNFEALNGLEMIRFSYKSYLQFFLEQRKMVKFRLYANRLQNVRTKYQEKIQYIQLAENKKINEIIKIVQNQKIIDDTVLMDTLMKKYNLTPLQARFIMECNVKKLSKGYLDKYKDEIKELKRLDELYMRYITDDSLIMQEILEELEEIKKRYAVPRVCKVITKEIAENIPDGTYKIIINSNGFIKKVPLDSNLSKKDNPIHVLKVENKDNLLLFTEHGKVFKLPVHKIDEVDTSSLGFDLRILIKGLASSVVKVINEADIIKASKSISKNFLVIVTEGNSIKKIDMNDICNVPPSGIIYTKLADGDIVKDICIVNNNLDIVVYSNRKALRLHVDDIPHYKRQARGVLAMGNKNKKIDGIEPIYKDAEYIVVITENGKINKFDVAGLTISERGKSGNSVINLSKGDNICSIFGVNDKHIIQIHTTKKIENLNVSDINIGSSISTGIKLNNMRGDQVVKCKVFLTK